MIDDPEKIFADSAGYKKKGDQEPVSHNNRSPLKPQLRRVMYLVGGPHHVASPLRSNIIQNKEATIESRAFFFKGPTSRHARARDSLHKRNWKCRCAHARPEIEQGGMGAKRRVDGDQERDRLSSCSSAKQNPGVVMQQKGPAASHN